MLLVIIEMPQVVQSKTIPATRAAVVATRKALAAAGDLNKLKAGGLFRTCIRAEVAIPGLPRAHSAEVFVSTDRNLRKSCRPPNG